MSSLLNLNSQLQLTKTFLGKNVFVTGHTGFKGAWLCEWLLSLGAKVHGFSLPEPVSSPCLFDQLGLASRMNDRRGDIRDGASVKKTVLEISPDFVFHLAAQPLVRLSYSTPVETWETNVMGTIHVLEALRALQEAKAASLRGVSTSDSNLSKVTTVAVLITTDKVYENREWLHGYREVDPLGGHDPYSSSKGAAEIAIASWRNSFFEDEGLRASCFVASARAGNVIGGGDWAMDRIVPDAIRALASGHPVPVRNKISTRPWQHVLEPLSGYLLLAARLAASVDGVNAAAGGVEGFKGGIPSTSQPFNPSTAELCAAFNFGPHLESNKTVEELVEEILKHWPGTWEDRSDPNAPHEAGKLNLVWDKAHHLLGWSPRWDFATTLSQTVAWYRGVHEGGNPGELTRRQIREYHAPL
ncbi:MAG: CDP-glucose 4,6-dehydratase [Candidatus Methylacidiphilales bacterium]|nr:CDP-glucose 4,6-dehydratase [Candidatus Methylacidiphilales bacterium]